MEARLGPNPGAMRFMQDFGTEPPPQFASAEQGRFAPEQENIWE